MKKLTSWVLLATLLFMLLPISTSASETNTVIYLDNGSYIIVTCECDNSRIAGVKNGKKTHNYYNANGDLQWTVILSGTFSYNGSVSVCTAASCDVSIYNSDWYVVSKNAELGGISAQGYAAMGRRYQGVTVETRNVSLTITCDANGNLS